MFSTFKIKDNNLSIGTVPVVPSKKRAAPDSLPMPEPKRSASIDPYTNKLCAQAAAECFATLSKVQEEYNQTITMLGFSPEYPLNPTLQELKVCIENVASNSLPSPLPVSKRGNLSEELNVFCGFLRLLKHEKDNTFTPVNIHSYLARKDNLLNFIKQLTGQDIWDQFVYTYLVNIHVHPSKYNRSLPVIRVAPIKKLLGYAPRAYAFSYIEDNKKNKYLFYEIQLQEFFSGKLMNDNSPYLLKTVESIYKTYGKEQKFQIEFHNPNKTTCFIKNINLRQWLIFCFPSLVTPDDLFNLDNYTSCTFQQHNICIPFVPLMPFLEEARINWNVTYQDIKKMGKFTLLIYHLIDNSKSYGYPIENPILCKKYFTEKFGMIKAVYEKEAYDILKEFQSRKSIDSKTYPLCHINESIPIEDDPIENDINVESFFESNLEIEKPLIRSLPTTDQNKFLNASLVALWSSPTFCNILESQIKPLLTLPSLIKNLHNLWNTPDQPLQKEYEELVNHLGNTKKNAKEFVFSVFSALDIHLDLIEEKSSEDINQINNYDERLISIPLTPYSTVTEKLNISELIKNYFFDEKDKFYSIKRTFTKQLPSLICLTLERYSALENKCYNNIAVEFPAEQILDFTPYLTPDLQLIGNANYKIISCIQHIGNDWDSDQYISYINQESQWSKMNEDQISLPVVYGNEDMQKSSLLFLELIQN